MAGNGVAAPCVAEIFGWPEGDPNVVKGQESDERLACYVEQSLGGELPELDRSRGWQVARGKVISDFAQYRHLVSLDALISADETGTLESVVGSGFLITPDVTVGVDLPGGRLFLHAAISCKWTIRSDRVQNIRHEGVILTRHRRGRQPHIVTVTAEPLPSRLAAIARGTGEVDGVYHVAFDELVSATDSAEDPDQRRILDVLIAQERLMRFEELVGTLLL